MGLDEAVDRTGRKHMQFQVLAALSRGDHTRQFQALVLDGRIQEAAAAAEERLADADALAGEVACDVAELCGDLMLALDRAEEAEETYRQAVRAAGRCAARGATRL